MFSQRTYIIFGIVLSIVMLSGYFLLSGKRSNWNISYHVDQNKTIDTYSWTLEKNTNQAKIDADKYNLAMKRQDIALCKDIQDKKIGTHCQDSINTLMAKNEKDPKKCMNLSQSGAQNTCHDLIMRENAIKYKNALLCNKLFDNDSKQECVESIESELLRIHIASGSISQSTCGDFVSQKYKNRCLSAMQEYDNTDLYRAAISNQDISLCMRITDNTNKNLCSDTIYIQQAISTKSIDTCNKITDLKKRNTCTLQISKNSDSAIRKKAIHTNDIALCQTINNPSYKTNCHDTIIYQQIKSWWSADLCAKLSSQEAAINCQKMLTQ